LEALAYKVWMLTVRLWASRSVFCRSSSSKLRAGLLSLGVGGGGGVLRIGALHALQMETSLGLMRPSLNAVGLRGDLVGDEGECKGPGRLFVR
jgi:hypothetical protein